MNAHQRRTYRRLGERFIRSVGDAMRLLEAKMATDPEGVRSDMREVIAGLDAMFAESHQQECGK